MTKTEAARVAAMGAALRPDWPAQSLLTLLLRDHADRAYRDTSVALAWIATDEATGTPARLAQAGPWWAATRLGAARRGPLYVGEPRGFDPDDTAAYLAWLRREACGE